MAAQIANQNVHGSLLCVQRFQDACKSTGPSDSASIKIWWEPTKERSFLHWVSKASSINTGFIQGAGSHSCRYVSRLLACEPLPSSPTPTAGLPYSAILFELKSSLLELQNGEGIMPSKSSSFHWLTDWLTGPCLISSSARCGAFPFMGFLGPTATWPVSNPLLHALLGCYKRKVKPSQPSPPPLSVCLHYSLPII